MVSLDVKMGLKWRGLHGVPMGMGEYYMRPPLALAKITF